MVLEKSALFTLFVMIVIELNVLNERKKYVLINLNFRPVTHSMMYKRKRNELSTQFVVFVLPLNTVSFLGFGA